MKNHKNKRVAQREIDLMDVEVDESEKANERPKREASPRKLRLAQGPASQSRLVPSKSRSRPLERR